MTVGERIRAARIRANLTQGELGAKLGMKKEAIYKYETSRVENIPLPKLRQIADILGVDAAYLAGWDNTQAVDAGELDDMLEALRSREDMRMLFSVSKGCTPDEIKAAVKMIEALKGINHD